VKPVRKKTVKKKTRRKTGPTVLEVGEPGQLFKVTHRHYTCEETVYQLRLASNKTSSDAEEIVQEWVESGHTSEGPEPRMVRGAREVDCEDEDEFGDYDFDDKFTADITEEPSTDDLVKLVHLLASGQANLTDCNTGTLQKAIEYCHLVCGMDADTPERKATGVFPYSRYGGQSYNQNDFKVTSFTEDPNSSCAKTHLYLTPTDASPREFVHIVEELRASEIGSVFMESELVLDPNSETLRHIYCSENAIDSEWWDLVTVTLHNEDYMPLVIKFATAKLSQTEARAELDAYLVTAFPGYTVG
jgi:hypothetical protein